MITAHKAPQTITPVFNPVAFEVSSTEQARSDFRYKVEVKDGSGNVLNTSYYPGGALITDRTFIDASGPLHRLQSFNHWRRDVQSGARLYLSSGFRVQYSVTISEEYDGTLHAVYNSGTLYAIPAALNSIRFGSYDYDTIKTFGRWLTDFTKMKVREGDKVTASYILPEASGAITNFTVRLYQIDGTLIDTATISNTSSTAVNNVVHLHIGISDLEAIFAGPIDFDILHRYTIDPGNGGPIMTVYVEEADCRHDGARLHFLNEWGGVDSFTFGLAVRRSTTIEKKKAKLPFTGSFLRPSIYGVGPSPYIVTFADRLKLSSGWITDEESNALLQLFTSPIVSIDVKKNLFFPDTTGEKIVIPCEVDLDSYDIKQKSTEKLFNLDIDVKISVDNTRQRL